MSVHSIIKCNEQYVWWLQWPLIFLQGCVCLFITHTSSSHWPLIFLQGYVCLLIMHTSSSHWPMIFLQGCVCLFVIHTSSSHWPMIFLQGCVCLFIMHTTSPTDYNANGGRRCFSHQNWLFSMCMLVSIQIQETALQQIAGVNWM